VGRDYLEYAVLCYTSGRKEFECSIRHCIQLSYVEKKKNKNPAQHLQERKVIAGLFRKEAKASSGHPLKYEKLFILD